MKIGIDLGGTKIEGILLDKQGKEMFRTRIATPRGDYAALLASVAQLVNALIIHAANLALNVTPSIGMGTPGSLNSQGLLRNSNTVELNGKPLQHDLQQLLQQPVRISNDANCFALSEATDGAAAQFKTVFGAIIGTGTGAGIVIDKQLLVGANSIGGEWGHNAMPWLNPSEVNNTLCYCGKRDCIETFLSGPALAQHYAASTRYPFTSNSKNAKDFPSKAIFAKDIFAKDISAKDIARMAAAGDAAAERALQQYERFLARALASVINLLDPECIVLGGGLSNLDRLYHNVPRLWGEYIFSDSIATVLVKPLYGDSSGVRGAAWLWE